MYKIIAAFSLYWHYLLDIILTHVFVIAFLSAGFPYVAALLMSTDAALKVTLSVIVSRFVARIHSTIRGKISVIIRFFLIATWFAAVIKLPINSITITSSVLIPFVIFKLLIMLDSSLCAEFVFTLRDKFKVDLTQSAAAQNILVRSSTAIAPAIAMMMLSIRYAHLIIAMLAIIIGLLCTVFLRSIFFSDSNKSFSFYEKPKSFTQLLMNPLMSWGLVFQMMGNLSFAGVAFLLLANLKLNGHLFLNDITVLYSVFLFMQFAVLIFGQRIIPANKLFHVALIMGGCGLFVFATGFISAGSLRFVACAGIGLTYSFVLSAVQKLVTSRLQGAGFIEYVGWAQMIGRLSSFLSTTTLGLILNFGYLPNTLLIWCGLLGMISPLFLISLREITWGKVQSQVSTSIDV